MGAQGDISEVWCALLEIQQGKPVENGYFQSLIEALDSYLRKSTKLLKVSLLKMTHDRISCRFKHGIHRGAPLEQLVRDLRSGSLDPEKKDLGLGAAFFKGKYRCITNRRTWCLWKAFGRGTPDDFTEQKRTLVHVYPLAPSFQTSMGHDFLFKLYDASTSR